MVSVEKIADFLGLLSCIEYFGCGSPDYPVRGPSLAGADSEQGVIFVGRSIHAPLDRLASAVAGLAIADISLRTEAKKIMGQGAVRAAIWSHNPRLDFARTMERFFVPPPRAGVHDSAIVGDRVVLGRNTYIGPGCIIGDDVTIGDGCQLDSRVTVYPRTHIGRNVLIHSGVVIGGDGFGYEKTEDGRWQKFPHFGGVLIGDNVEIGAGATVDRGTLGNTCIGVGAKIDNLVHVAHNARVGDHSIIIAGAVVCGSADIGSGTWISPQACIRDGVVVGRDSTVGLGAVVTGSAPERSVLVGWSAMHVKLAKKVSNLLRRVGC